jgi:hypothetical protein
MCNFFSDRSMVGNTAPLPVEAMEAVEEMLASRYSSNPTVVGIDMFNEPWFERSCGSPTSEGQMLTTFYTEMGESILGVNPHLLLIFEDPPPGLMPRTPIIASPPSIPNAMYSFHIYTGNWSTAQPYMQEFLGNAQTWGVPAWMGEFDAFEAGCTGVNCNLDPNWRVDTQTLLAYCNTNGISWAFFSYYSLGTNVHTPVPHSEILAVLRASLPLSTISSSTTTTSTSTRVSEFSSSALIFALLASMLIVVLLVRPRTRAFTSRARSRNEV